MIIKKRDASPDVIQALEIQASRTRDSVRRAACHGAAARLRADTTTLFATDLVDVQFGQSDDWAVIHDLRLRVAGHAVQINHLLISSTLNFFCLDTRFIDYGLDLDDNGQCHLFDRLERRAVASPLNKASKDARKLAELVKTPGLLPKQFGIVERKATVEACVLTNPALRLAVSEKVKEGAASVYPSNAVFSMLWKTGFSSSGMPRSRLNAESLHAVAQSIARFHIPVFPVSLLRPDSLVTEQTRLLLAR